MGLFDDKDDKDENDIGIKVDNDDLLETAAMLFKVQAKVSPESLKMINNPTVLVEEYLKIFRALKDALKQEKNIY